MSLLLGIGYSVTKAKAKESLALTVIKKIIHEDGVTVKEWIYYLRGYDVRKKFRMLTWTTFIGQFVHPAGGEVIG